MKYGGMTVNERLYVAGKIENYYHAIDEKNVDEIIRILHSVELDDKNINFILKQKKLLK
jgi:hypothetical protein